MQRAGEGAAGPAGGDRAGGRWGDDALLGVTWVMAGYPSSHSIGAKRDRPTLLGASFPDDATNPVAVCRRTTSQCRNSTTSLRLLPCCVPVMYIQLLCHISPGCGTACHLQYLPVELCRSFQMNAAA